MIGKKRVIALIPARGGSKGIPDKNVKSLAGKPLIAWTIEVAKNSKYVDRIVVSTEDDRIAEISRKYGADVPFKRPCKLATDDANMMDVIRHSLMFFKEQKETCDILVLLQPTSPLRGTDDIDGAIEFFVKKDAKAVVSVVKCEDSPEWSGKIPSDLSLRDFIREDARGKNRQQLDDYYRINGAIFLAEREHLDKTGDWYGPGTFAYLMSRERSVDIDDPFDFEIAESILQRKKEQ